MTELVGGDLTETFESCYLRISTQALDSLYSLFVGITVDGFLLVSHAEQRRL